MRDSYYDPPEPRTPKGGIDNKTISLPVPSVGDYPRYVEYEADILFDEGNFFSAVLTWEYRPRADDEGRFMYIEDVEIKIKTEYLPAQLRSELEEQWHQACEDDRWDS